LARFPNAFGDPGLSLYCPVRTLAHERISKVVSIGRVQHKVRGCVVLSVIILVVNDFFRTQVATNRLLDNQPMFSNVAVSISMRVIGPEQQDISIFVNLPTAFPAPILRARARPLSFHLKSVLAAYFVNRLETLSITTPARQ